MDDDWRRIAPAARTIWGLTGAAAVTTTGLVLAVLAAASGAGGAGIALLVLAAAIAGVWWWASGRRWAAWGYAERERDLMIRRGVLVRRLTIVPYGRMQFVDVRQGPLAACARAVVREAPHGGGRHRRGDPAAARRRSGAVARPAHHTWRNARRRLVSWPEPDFAPAPVAPGGWRRLHPLSPLLRAGRAVLVLAAVSLDSATELVLESSVGTIVLVLLGVVAVAALYSWAAWRSTVYRIGPDELELRTGIVFRSHRRVPIARVESVDVARPIVPRMLGLAQVRVESVSQGKTEVRLSYLEEQGAAAVRDELAARQRPAVATTEGAAPAPATTGRPIVQIPTGELLLAIVGARVVPAALLLLPVTLVVAVFAGAAALGVLGVGAVMLVVLAVTAIAEAEKLYGFTLGESDDGMHIRRGLLNELHQRVAAGAHPSGGDRGALALAPVSSRAGRRRHRRLSRW